LAAMLRILLADDHTMVRQGLRRILEEHRDWRVVAEAGDGRQAVQQTLDHQPDVAVLDITMPRLNGIEAVRQIARRAPSVRILVLSMHADEAHITQAVQAGACGYLLKDSADVDVVTAVESVAQGKSFFSPAAAEIMQADYRRSVRKRGITDRYETLTEREREVFQLIAEGHSNKEIALLLYISPVTVETHRAHILKKLDLHSAADIVLDAVRRGIIS
jgi:two-component system, NarL family, response regulator NreC